MVLRSGRESREIIRDKMDDVIVGLTKAYAAGIAHRKSACPKCGSKMKRVGS